MRQNNTPLMQKEMLKQNTLTSFEKKKRYILSIAGPKNDTNNL